MNYMYFICKAGTMLGVTVEECQTQQAKLGLHEKFQNHIQEWGLTYGTKEEYQFRMSLFAEVDELINTANSQGNHFTLGHNQFSTLTDFEKKKFNGFLGERFLGNDLETHLLDDTNLKDAVDWRTKGGVTPIKNQGGCGSCWAFSATAAMENAHFRKTGYLNTLSEQQLVSCSKSNYGCGGGWQSAAFDYLHTNPQTTEEKYPYVSGNGKTGYCSAAQVTTGWVSALSYRRVKPYSTSQLKAAIQEGVVAVTVDAGSSVFQQYRSGILDSNECGTHLNHAVAAVGWGHDEQSGHDYYIIRNSWSGDWGDQGYIKIAAIEGQGICGIQIESLIPTTN